MLLLIGPQGLISRVVFSKWFDANGTPRGRLWGAPGWTSGKDASTVLQPTVHSPASGSGGAPGGGRRQPHAPGTQRQRDVRELCS